MEILLRVVKADTLILVEGMTDGCVHYTFVNGHPHGHYMCVAEEGGTSCREPHDHVYEPLGKILNSCRLKREGW